MSEVKCIICGEPTGLSEEDLDHAAPVCSEACNDVYHERMEHNWDKITQTLDTKKAN